MKPFSKHNCLRRHSLVRCVVVTSVVLAGLALGPNASPAVLAPADSFALEPWWEASDALSDNIPPVSIISHSVDRINEREIQLSDIDTPRVAPRRWSAPGCRAAMDRLPRQIESRSKGTTPPPLPRSAARRVDGTEYVVPFETSQHCARFAALCQLLVDA